MKTIASLPVGQTNELIEHLNEMAIPHVTRIVPYPSGVDLSEIMVEDSYFDRGYEVASAWNAEQLSKLAANEKPSSTPAATTKSKWPLFWAFFSGLFFVSALDNLRDGDTSRAVIQLLLSAFGMMKAVHDQNGGRFYIDLMYIGPQSKSGKITAGMLLILAGVAGVAFVIYDFFVGRAVASANFLLLSGVSILCVFDGIKTIYALRHANMRTG
jgi:hypothetical protein